MFALDILFVLLAVHSGFTVICFWSLCLDLSDSKYTFDFSFVWNEHGYIGFCLFTRNCFSGLETNELGCMWCGQISKARKSGKRRQTQRWHAKDSRKVNVVHSDREQTSNCLRSWGVGVGNWLKGTWEMSYGDVNAWLWWMLHVVFTWQNSLNHY